MWVQGQNNAIDKYGFKVKGAEYEPNEALPRVAAIGKIIKAPEEYLDERGAVTSDYQDQLEKQWIEQLRAKYEVKINTDVLNELR